LKTIFNWLSNIVTSSGPNLSEYHATFQNVSDQFRARFIAAYHILTFWHSSSKFLVSRSDLNHIKNTEYSIGNHSNTIKYIYCVCTQQPNFMGCLIEFEFISPRSQFDPWSGHIFWNFFYRIKKKWPVRGRPVSESEYL
jgi:hypothetical protein